MPETKLNLYPTMVIGLGGTGTNVVRLAKRRFMRTWNGALAQRRSQLAAQGLPIATLEDVEDLPPMLQVLAVDTEPRTNRPLEEPLYHHEFAFLGKFDATKLVRNKDQHPYLGTWWKWNENGQEEIPLGFIHTGAKQLRPIGRLAYFRHYVSFKDVLRKKLVAMLDVPAIEQAQNNYISVNTDQRVIYIVSSVCGGTGAGMFIDVAHTVRHYASELFSGKSNIHIVGVFLMPSVFENEVRSALQRRRIRANAFAALRELNHFHTHQDFKAWYPSEQQPIPTTPYRAFNQIFIVERDDVNGKSLSTKAAAEQMVAQLVHLTTFSTLNSTIFGQDVNVTEERKANAASGGRSYLAYSSFGASALVMPRVALWRYFVAQTTGWALSNFFIDRSDPQPLMGIYKKLIDDLKSEFNKHYESSKKNKSTKALEALAADMGENTGRWTPLRGYFEEAMRSALSNLQDAGMGGLWLFLQAILAPEGNARPGWLTHPATIPCPPRREVPQRGLLRSLTMSRPQTREYQDRLQAANVDNKANDVWAEIVRRVQAMAREWVNHVEQMRKNAPEIMRSVQVEAQRAAMEIDPMFPSRDPETSTYYDLETGAVGLDQLTEFWIRTRDVLTPDIRKRLLQAIYGQLEAITRGAPAAALNFPLTVREALENIPGLRDAVYGKFDMRYIVHLQRRREGRPPNDRFDQIFQRVSPHAAVDGDTYDYHEAVQEHTRIVSVPKAHGNGNGNGQNGRSQHDGTSHVAEEDPEDRAFRQALRDYNEFNVINGTEGERIDILHIVHGLPISQLRSIPELYAEYRGPIEALPNQTVQQMQAEREFTPRMLHIDPDYVDPNSPKYLDSLYIDPQDVKRWSESGAGWTQGPGANGQPSPDGQQGSQASANPHPPTGQAQGMPPRAGFSSNVGAGVFPGFGYEPGTATSGSNPAAGPYEPGGVFSGAAHGFGLSDAGGIQANTAPPEPDQGQRGADPGRPSSNSI